MKEAVPSLSLPDTALSAQETRPTVRRNRKLRYSGSILSRTVSPKSAQTDERIGTGYSTRLINSMKAPESCPSKRGEQRRAVLTLGSTTRSRHCSRPAVGESSARVQESWVSQERANDVRPQGRDCPPDSTVNRH